jgi:hypothetical protein
MYEIATRCMRTDPSLIKQYGLFAAKHPGTGKVHVFESRAELNAFQKANRSKWTKWASPICA